MDQQYFVTPVHHQSHHFPDKHTWTVCQRGRALKLHKESKDKRTISISSSFRCAQKHAPAVHAKIDEFCFNKGSMVIKCQIRPFRMPKTVPGKYPDQLKINQVWQNNKNPNWLVLDQLDKAFNITHNNGQNEWESNYGSRDTAWSCMGEFKHNHFSMWLPILQPILAQFISDHK